MSCFDFYPYTFVFFLSPVEAVEKLCINIETWNKNVFVAAEPSVLLLFQVFL